MLIGAVPVVQAQPSVPVLTGRVVDRAEILSPTTEATLTARLARHEAATSNQVAVLTIASLEGAAIESFSLRVAETWGLGTAAHDNGVLLLVARDDRALRIEVGRGLEGSLTDVVSGRIIRGVVVPRFRAGDYEGGVASGVEAILGVIEGTYEPPEVAEDEMPLLGKLIVGLLFFCMPSLFAFFGVFTPGPIRWFMCVFLLPFFFVSGFLITESPLGGLLIVGLYLLIYISAMFHPKVKAARKGKTVKVGPFTLGGLAGGWSSGSGGGWSSGGGGFSGGGGSFGGGGASGGW